MSATELFHAYSTRQQCHLKPYLAITDSAPLHPVIYDSQQRVLSLPPIINGDHSKITLATRNILIECTGTDLIKLEMALSVLVSAWSEWCADKHSIEAVCIDNGSTTRITPNLESRQFTVRLAEISSMIGAPLQPEQMSSLLDRMQLSARVDGESLQVHVPAFRSDVMHAVDIIEDVAIAYGYNNIQKTVPRSHTTGRALPLNKFADRIRQGASEAGFTEVLTWTLCSRAEAFTKMRLDDDGKTAVVLSNPKTAEFEICRVELLPGLLKALSSNMGHVTLPVKLFEVGDVVLLDPQSDVGARNRRQFAAAFSSKVSGFEIIHGLLDRIMQLCGVPFVPSNAQPSTPHHYTIREIDHPTYFPGRCAAIFLDGQRIGQLGVLHPEVLSGFEIPYLCSAVEFELESLLAL